ncbi:MAG: HEAT repeat domain-containing protein, partial [Myxococcales bacterium]|nr:HEAT repeat domain-containing protein [Myxococcales bacterium]
MEKRSVVWTRLWILLVFVLLAGGLGYQQLLQRRWEGWQRRVLQAPLSKLPAMWAALPVSEKVLVDTMLPRFLRAKQPARLRIAWLLGKSRHVELSWLKAYLHHKEWKVREGIVFALGRSASRRQAELALLDEALKDKKAFVRFRAVHALKRFGDEGRRFLDTLFAELQEGAPTEADLHSHNPNDPNSHSAHEHIHNPRKQKGFFCGKPPDPGWEVRYAILQILPHIEPNLKQQATWYRLALSDKDERVRHWSREALARLGSSAYE